MNFVKGDGLNIGGVYRFGEYSSVSVSLAPTCQPSPIWLSSLTSIASLGQAYYCIRLSVCVVFLKAHSIGCSKISKILTLGAKFAEKFPILYKQAKTYFIKNVHLKSVSKHEGQVKRDYQGEWWHLWGGVQIVEYQVKSTSLNELLRYITILTMKFCSAKNKQWCY